MDAGPALTHGTLRLRGKQETMLRQRLPEIAAAPEVRACRGLPAGLRQNETRRRVEASATTRLLCQEAHSLTRCRQERGPRERERDKERRRHMSPPRETGLTFCPALSHSPPRSHHPPASGTFPRSSPYHPFSLPESHACSSLTRSSPPRATPRPTRREERGVPPSHSENSPASRGALQTPSQRSGILCPCYSGSTH